MAQQNSEREQIINQFGNLPELSPIPTPIGRPIEYSIATFSPNGTYVRFEREGEVVEYALRKVGSEDTVARREIETSSAGYTPNARVTFALESQKIDYHLHYTGHVPVGQLDTVLSNPMYASIAVGRNIPFGVPIWQYPTSVTFGVIYEENSIMGHNAKPGGLHIQAGGIDHLPVLDEEFEDPLSFPPGVTFKINDDLTIELASINLRELAIKKPFGSSFDLGEILPYSYRILHEGDHLTFTGINKQDGREWGFSFPAALDVNRLDFLLRGISPLDWLDIPEDFPVSLKP